jgi:hypothetical protein
MLIFMEKIDPPPPIVQVADEDLVAQIAERLMQEDRWVKNFIDGLAGKVARLAPI